ncbi:Uncharacterised protein [Mycobacteroides abscessus subsp. abscessus]|nr:Uncharacterised protein [Mycobacteroides abscessus subsp. abscessus]
MQPAFTPPSQPFDPAIKQLAGLGTPGPVRAATTLPENGS